MNGNSHATVPDPRSLTIQQGEAEIPPASSFDFGDLIVASHRLLRAFALLGILMLCGAPRAQAMLPPLDAGHALRAGNDANPEGMQFAQAQPLPTPSPSPMQPAAAPTPTSSPPPATPAPSDEPIGNVATVAGTATVIRNKDSIALKLKDDIFLNDTVQTSSGASLDITFSDDSTFHLSASARITIDSYVYEPGGNNNAGIFDIGKGTVAFVAAQVAKTGNMQINTPAASLGIRGTSGLVEVPEGGGAAAGAQNIKLYPDADGHVGRIEVSDRQGARLGTLTQGASGFAVRPGVAGARATAVPLTISPQQAARDQGIVRQVHVAQTTGRQIVTEQRAIRRANPPQPGQPPRPPGQPQRQQQPGTNRPGQPQPGAPKGQKQTPGTPNGQKQTPGTPNGQKQTPGTAPTPGTPNRQGSQQPGAPSQPGAPNRQSQQQPGTPQPAEQGHSATPPQHAGQSRPGDQQPGARPQAQRPKPPPAPARGKKKNQR